MTELFIKKLHREDLPLLFSPNQYNDPEDMLLKNGALLGRGAAGFYGLFSGTELIGEVRAKYEDADPEIAFPGQRAYLYALRIRKEYRRRGLAAYLLESVMAENKRNGYREFTIGVEDDNPAAIGLYQKLGFSIHVKRVQESYQGDAYEYSLLMRKEPNERYGSRVV